MADNFDRGEGGFLIGPSPRLRLYPLLAPGRIPPGRKETLPLSGSKESELSLLFSPSLIFKDSQLAASVLPPAVLI